MEAAKQILMKKLIQNPALIRRELNNRSLYEFVQYFWDVISEDPLQLNWHMEFLCMEVQDVIERVIRREDKAYDLLINIPPGTTKTTICSVMAPAWAWTRAYWLKFITASYSMPLSLEASELCKDLVTSDKYKALYPEIRLKPDKEAKSNYKVIKILEWNKGRVAKHKIGGGRYTTSVGGTVTGFHSHVFIWDDPMNPKIDNSPEQIQKTNNWVSRIASTRKTDKNKSVMIGIMQRLHENDPSGHILNKKKKKLKHICLPGTLENYEEYVKPPELKAFYVNGMLDPNRLDETALEELKIDLGQYGFAGQVGQNPTPPGGGMFKIGMFQITDTFPHESLIDENAVVRYWDKAGTTDGGAYTVGVKMYKLKDGRYFIPDVKRRQVAALDRENLIKATAQADGKKCRIYIEQEPGSGGKESAQSTIRNLDGYHCEADHPQGSKVYRADPYSVQVNGGNVLLLRAEWNEAFIEEHKYFPLSKYKDQVDGASGAYAKLSRGKQARVL